MCLADFKEWQRKLPFWKRLKWYAWSVEMAERLTRDRLDGLRRGQSKESIEWYEREKNHQLDRAKWLYENLWQEYESLEREKIKWQKLALTNMKKR